MQNFTKLFLVVSVFLCSTPRTFAQDPNLEAAKLHLQNNQKKYNLSVEDLKEMAVSSAYISPTTGWYHAYFNQTYQAIDVFNGVLNVTLKDGHIVHIANSFIPFLDNQLLTSSSLRTIDAKTAIINSLNSLNLKPSKAQDITQISSVSNIKNEIVNYKFADNTISNEPIDVKLYWFQHDVNKNGKLLQQVSLCWNVSFLTLDKHNAWSVQVDANTGTILSTFDNVIKCNFGHKHAKDKSFEACQDLSNQKKEVKKSANLPNSYNVFNYKIESPIHGSRSIVTNPYTTFAPAGTGPGSTNGWHHDGINTFTDTRGNNVHAQDDTDANNTGGNRPNPANYDFDYPYTFGLSTSALNQNAAITNLFYWNNLVHDVLWKMGFDEPAGNFQTNNLNRGGLGNDHLIADAQDGSGTNNAEFYSTVDGANSRMQMFIWTEPSTYQADSDFDNAIIGHEYGHGWSIRLTGGPNNISCLYNAEQGGEGWSDYLGLMLTTNWDLLTPTVASANIPRGIGTYVIGEPNTGVGIRPYPYSYNMAGVNPTVTYAAVGNSSFSQPHGIGSIWATILWDMTWEIIFQDNAIENNIFNTSNMIGNVAALKLVNEGLRLQPCSPSFVQARDAILAADQALFGGRYRCAIGRAFTRRGLGLNASTGISTNDRTVTADYTNISGNAISSPVVVNLCSGIPLQYTATSNTEGTVFSWNRAAVSGISNASASDLSANINETLINTTTNPIIVNYSFTLSPSGCGVLGQVQQNIQVTVNPAPFIPTVATYSVCQNGVVPSGQGLSMPSAGVSNPIQDALVSGPTFIRPARTASEYYYKSYSYIAQVSGSVTFNITSGNFDTFLVLYQNSFDPTNSNTNMITFNDDSGGSLLSSITYNVVQGNTYFLVVSSYSSLNTGSYTLNTTNGGYGSLFQWYTTPTSSTPIYSGSLFNPVGVGGSGIINTIIPIVKNYYVARNDNTACRSTTTFTVSPSDVSPLLSGVVSTSDTICAIFNGGILTLSQQTGNIIGWETSENKFKTWQTALSTNLTYSYSGLVKSRQVRAILDRGNCLVARSAMAELNVISPIQILSDSVNIDTVLNKTSLNIVSNQKISSDSKVHYAAGRKIELNQGFQSATGSIFKAEIVENDCFIPVTLTLQPDSSQSKDGDISNLFPKISYPNNRYLVPYSWIQFSTPEIRRSLIQFDLSSIPNNAVIDSAFLSLSFSQQLVTDNPPFTGHFGTNALEIKRITGIWNSATACWNNQPGTSNSNMVVVPAATSLTQNYPKIAVKDLVTDLLGTNNYGFMIKHQTETAYKITCLASSEELVPNKRPKLTIHYRYK